MRIRGVEEGVADIYKPCHEGFIFIDMFNIHNDPMK